MPTRSIPARLRPPLCTSRAPRLLGLAVVCLLTAPEIAHASDAGEPPPIWLVVSRPQLVDAVKPLADKRREEGFETIISTTTVTKALAEAPRRPRYLLLVGDDEAGKKAEPWYLPSKQRRLYRWAAFQPESFASDAAWGDVDRDLVPDTAVGRIPARTAGEVEVVVKKILDFEKQPPTAQDLQLPVWAGSPMYGPMIDSSATGLLVSSIVNGAPPWATPWILTADTAQPFCAWPPDQVERFCRRVRMGGMCEVLIGHGDKQAFYAMRYEDRYIRFTSERAATQFAEGAVAPPLILLVCDAGDFTCVTPCLAESLLFLPGGPVAAIGATTPSHPVPNYYLGQSLLWAMGEGETRLGDLWLKAEKHALRATSPIIERVLRDAEGKLEDPINVRKLRRDGALMYALLGDPATRLRLPQPLRATVERTGESWRWTAERPADATRLEIGFQPAGRPWPQLGSPPPADREQANAALDRANAFFAFEPQAALAADKPWTGTVEQPGRLRLVAIAPGKLYVAALDLQPTAP